jgi:hypothetical protein
MPSSTSARRTGRANRIAVITGAAAIIALMMDGLPFPLFAGFSRLAAPRFGASRPVTERPRTGRIGPGQSFETRIFRPVAERPRPDSRPPRLIRRPPRRPGPRPQFETRFRVSLPNAPPFPDPSIRQRFETRNVTLKLESVTEKLRSVTEKLRSVTENSRFGMSPDGPGTT